MGPFIPSPRLPSRLPGRGRSPARRPVGLPALPLPLPASAWRAEPAATDAKSFGRAEGRLPRRPSPSSRALGVAPGD